MAILEMPPQNSAFDQLSARVGIEWTNIRQARDDARQQLRTLRQYVGELRLSSDTSAIGFGSLAREEWTGQSDIDWTLLIDGPADIAHFHDARRIEEMLLDNNYPKPGSTGTFGSMSISHQLVHDIGGLEDTNQNLTRRMLLLLESSCLSDRLVHERVCRAILQRYIEGDPPSTRRDGYYVPLFLLNDIVRFWRTLGVDYAAKKWRRSNEEWALKNVKLRMSRKLLFAKGLLMCFLCDEAFAGRPRNQAVIDVELQELCWKTSRNTPLDLVSQVALHFNQLDLGRTLWNAYDQYIDAMRDSERRDRLKKLSFEVADGDPEFEALRHVSREFRDALVALLLDADDQLAALTKRYGVF